jgi:hypothetical protein
MWMIGEVEPLKSLQQPEKHTAVVERIVSEYPNRLLPEGDLLYRLRRDPREPSSPAEYDSPLRISEEVIDWIARTIQAMRPRTLLLDGEVIAIDRRKISRFQLPQRRVGRAHYAVFDRPTAARAAFLASTKRTVALRVNDRLLQSYLLCYHKRSTVRARKIAGFGVSAHITAADQ